jgi:hypothetical protein
MHSLDKTTWHNYLSTVWTTFYRADHHTTTPHCDKMYCQKCPNKYSSMVCITFYRPRHHTTTHQMGTKYTLHNSLIVIGFCFSCGTPCKIRKGLENHRESWPGCLDELDISWVSNWTATLRLPSVTTSSKAINHHLFCVKTDAKLATKYLVEVM